MMDKTKNAAPLAKPTRQYTLPFPARFDPEINHAGVVEEWLRDQGIDVAWSAITKDGVVVEAGMDPTEVFASYEPMVSRRDDLKAQLLELDVTNADLATLRAAVSLMKQLIVQE